MATTLLNARPCSSNFDVRNSSLVNRVVGCNVDLPSLIATYCRYLFWCQLGLWISNPLGAMPGFVARLHVALRSSPTQVFKRIVMAYIVIVQALISEWARAYKCFQHKPMNLKHLRRIVLFLQVHNTVAVIVRNLREQFSRGVAYSAPSMGLHSINGSNAACATDLISPLVSHDGQPTLFHVRPPIAKVPCDWCVAAARKTAVRSNPSHAGSLYG